MAQSFALQYTLNNLSRPGVLDQHKYQIIFLVTEVSWVNMLIHETKPKLLKVLSVFENKHKRGNINHFYRQQCVGWC